MVLAQEEGGVKSHIIYEGLVVVTLVIVIASISLSRYSVQRSSIH